MWDDLPGWIKKFEVPLAIVAGAICLTVILLNLDFYFLEANLYDLRMARGFQSAPNKDIVLVSIDDSTTKDLDELAPLPLEYHTRFLELLQSAGPKAIGYLIDMNHVQQLSSDHFDNQWSGQFLSSIQKMEENGTHFLLGTPFDVTGEVLPPAPLDRLPHSVAIVHKDGNVFSEDKITRRALLSLYDKPAFHLDMARRLGHLGSSDLPRGAFYVPEVQGEYFFFRYHGSTSMISRPTHERTYERYSFSDILRERISPEVFKNKIVLVGTISSDDSSDFALTPYSKTAFTNSKLIIHANILDSVMKRDGIQRAPGFINWLVTFLVTTTVLWWIMTSTPLYGVFATLTLALAFIVISQAFFQLRGLWVKESQPLVGIFVSYYLAVPYRLIREYKKRWDYQRKNELLMQVEELKTNFMSLVTHDLKTPVARIQGLTEILLRRSSLKLDSGDRETLEHIIASADELNRFISSILELSKVESNHIQLNFESKDINQLIEKCACSFQAQADSRKIQIKMNLEPLFPIKIDSSLISKVLNNLIDNAIKYSTPNSEIEIESKEDDNWIVIAIRDQGIGMTQEERESLFTRFYRAKNDTTTAIAGTGLGLYLTKYFIEAHHGKVEVESEKEKGSTFKIFLPIQVNLTQLNDAKETFHVQSPCSG
jgi:signal transduction histidine kinase